MKKEVTNKILWLFAIGQLGWSLLSGIITNWLVYFYQPTSDVIAAGQPLFIPQGAVFLGLTVIGLIAASGRIFDAITDPWIAGKSDRCRNKDGRRIPFMRAIAVPFGAITVLIFLSPVSTPESPVNAAFLLVMSLLFYLFMTIYCTPYNALIPALGKTQKNRINISTFISLTFIVGTALAYLVPNIAGFFEESLGYVNSRRITIAIMAAFGTICLLVPVFAIREKDYVSEEPSDTPAFKSLKKTFKNKQFRIFVGSDVLYFVALTMFQTGLPFYVTALMKLDEGMNFILFALMTACSLLFYIPVNRLAMKFGKKKLVVTAFILYALVFLFTSFAGLLGISSTINGIIIAVAASIPMAILGILPQAIVADISECDSLETKENREGMFFAARTFAFKLGQSIAMLLFTSVAKLGENGMGYRFTAIIAAVLCLLGGIVLFRYNEKLILGKITSGREDAMQS